MKYRVVKSDIFQKKIFPNYEKQSQFDKPIRTYWDKIINGKEKEEQPTSEDSPTKCKIIDVQTKVEDVKKKFEP